MPASWGYADWACEEKFVFVCRSAAPGTFTYNSPVSNYTYTFNTQNMTFAEGEAFCEGIGGHLVTYSSQEEQTDAEQYFITQGMLMPGFHAFYWMGLTTENWPTFFWTDQTPYTANVSWDNWGYYMPQNIREPNNIFKEEFCAGANFSERNTNLKPAIWGWADTKCNAKYPIMCRKNRESQRRPAGIRHPCLLWGALRNPEQQLRTPPALSAALNLACCSPWRVRLPLASQQLGLLHGQLAHALP